MRLLGPNTLGLLNTAHGLVTGAYRYGSNKPPIGGVSYCSQTGFLTFGVHPIRDLGQPISKICDFGNKCDLSEADLLPYLADDPTTDVICMHLEDIRDGKRFRRAAREAVARKPVMILKPGRSEVGARAASSHTGSLAGNDPGQTGVATVRAQGYSPIESIAVQLRGSALGSDQWESANLDSQGRLRLVPSQPGLIEIEVRAIDQDGFSATHTHIVRVKDPADTQAPLLAWGGVLQGASVTSAPVIIQQPAMLRVRLQEQQLMGYQLDIAAAGSGDWYSLLEQQRAAASTDADLDLVELDPARLHNGLYRLRLSAWDVAGRTSEIDATVIIDSAQKNLDVQSACDRTFTLAGHAFALNRHGAR